MCEICNQIPCHPRCPNAEEKVVDICSCCNDEIMEGYNYYILPSGDAICTDCADVKFNDDPDEPEVTCGCCEKTLEYDERYILTSKGERFCFDCIEVID